MGMSMDVGIFPPGVEVSCCQPARWYRTVVIGGCRSGAGVGFGEVGGMAGGGVWYHLLLRKY